MKPLEQKSIRHRFPKTIEYKGHTYHKIHIDSKLRSGDIFPPGDGGAAGEEWCSDNHDPYQDDIGTPLYRRNE